MTSPARAMSEQQSPDTEVSPGRVAPTYPENIIFRLEPHKLVKGVRRRISCYLDATLGGCTTVLTGLCVLITIRRFYCKKPMSD
jgi:hypothetical protein